MRKLEQAIAPARERWVHIAGFRLGIIHVSESLSFGPLVARCTDTHLRTGAMQTFGQATVQICFTCYLRM